ncbi:MAG: hypothetical protein HOV81_31105 [Kofleriaceae bacterium]|nr:hypothetical protein [Kofleriaceae bacterium]
MARKFNLASLFEPWKYDPKLDPYKTFDHVLDAVSSGKKALWRDGWAALEEGDPNFGKLVRKAFEHGLAVTLVQSRLSRGTKNWQSEVYLLERKPAHPRARSAQADDVHRTETVDVRARGAGEPPLGYSAKQRRDWLASHQRSGFHSGGRTVYALLSRDQTRLVQSLGRRCFGPEDAVDGMTFHYHSGDVLLKKDAFARLPKDTTLARASVHWRAIEPMFGPWKKMRGLVRATATKKTAASMSTQLLSNVELLTRSGWK